MSGPTCTRDSPCNVGRAPDRPPVEPKHKNRWEWSGGPKTQHILILDRLGRNRRKQLGQHSLVGKRPIACKGTNSWGPLWQVSGSDGSQPLSVRAWWVWPNKVCLVPTPLSFGRVAYRQTPHYPHSPHYLT